MNRKIIVFFTSLLLLLAVVIFPACQKSDEPPTPVVIDLTGVIVEEGDTLLDVMQDMQVQGSLSFTIRDGMITEINGTSNTMSSYWMLYTSDDDPAMSNSQWGTYIYGEQTLASAAFGAEMLLVKTGKIYVWVYQTF